MTECCPRIVHIVSDGADVVLVHPDEPAPSPYAYVRVRGDKVERTCPTHGRVVYDLARRKEAKARGQ